MPPLRRPRVPAQLLHTFSHLPLADSFSDDQDQLIDILVGQDQYWELVRAGLFRSPEGLVAQETVFGWVLSGRAEGPPGSLPVTGGASCQLLTMTDMPAGRNLWSLDGSGSDDASEPDVLQEFKDYVSYDDGRYVVKLPWRSDGSVSKLMDNREAAESRLASLSRKLDRDPLLKEKYNAALCEMESSDVICEVPSDELCSEFPTYYLPHRPVVKQGSTGMKVRPVFDASAKGYNGLSLNDCVETGPAMIPSLPEILMRFRRWRFGFSADIVKAFLQVRLDHRDQDVHRFLWSCGDRVRVMRFQRVTFGVACSPFLPNATIQQHLSQYGDSAVVMEMRENFYMDDLLSGADSEAEVVSMFKEARSIMGAAGMELSKCCAARTALQTLMCSSVSLMVAQLRRE